MPRKAKTPTVQEKMDRVNQFFSFSKEELFENLNETEKKELLANCSLLFNNPALQRIGDEIYTKELIASFSKSGSFEDLVEGRGYLFGLAAMFETIRNFHLLYLDSVKPQETFDRQEVI